MMEATCLSFKKQDTPQHQRALVFKQTPVVRRSKQLLNNVNSGTLIARAAPTAVVVSSHRSRGGPHHHRVTDMSG